MNMTTNEMNAINRELLQSFDSSNSFPAISRMALAVTSILVALSLIAG